MPRAGYSIRSRKMKIDTAIDKLGDTAQLLDGQPSVLEQLFGAACEIEDTMKQVAEEIREAECILEEEKTSEALDKLLDALPELDKLLASFKQLSDAARSIKDAVKRATETIREVADMLEE